MSEGRMVRVVKGMLKVAKSVDELHHHRRVDSGLKLGDWVWCGKCGQVFQYGEYQSYKGTRYEYPSQRYFTQYCPYHGCHGSALDWWPWDHFRGGNEGYPEVPVRGVSYWSNVQMAIGARVPWDPNPSLSSGPG